MLHILQTTHLPFSQASSFYTLNKMLLEPQGIEVTQHSNWESVKASKCSVVLHLCHRDQWHTVKRDDGTQKNTPLRYKWKGIENLIDTYPSGIDNIRGSRYVVDGIIVIPTYHPENVNQEYKNWTLLELDLGRVLKDQRFGYKQKEHKTTICYTKDQAIEHLQKLIELHKEDPDFYSCCDIEGALDSGGIECIGFSFSADEGFTIPFCDLDGEQMFNSFQEVEIWDTIQQVFNVVPMVFHNAMYDLFVLAYGYGILCPSLLDDTMLKTWELYCEFNKSLGFAVSIYTDFPYYKFERLAETLEEQLVYNIKDCCLTHEVNDVMNVSLQNDHQSQKAYEERMEVLWVALHMALQGLNEDQDFKGKLLDGVLKELEEAQKAMDLAWLDLPLGQEATKKAATELQQHKDKLKHYEEKLQQTNQEIKQRNIEKKPITKKLLNDQRVCLNQIQKFKQKIVDFEWPKFNAKSWPEKERLLYSKNGMGLKKPKSKSSSATEALVLFKLITTKNVPDEKKEILRKLVRLIELRTNISDIEKLTVDKLDGRLRCGYNVVGTVSGRWSCRESNVPERGFRLW